MWLLSTDRAELRYFARNFDAIGGYAILSHTWDNGGEQTLQEVRAIGEQCKVRRTNPRDFVHPKIRNCCIVAEKHGYRWVWIDSCCIDKTSSSELSEAINSMFRWYKEAEVCFAYLADVPHYCDLSAPASVFQKSRWHTRGWTLQELIAPDLLIFLSADWHELGNRADLAPLLGEITGVPAAVLTGKTQPGNYSVSHRMSWASRRKTTRVEDEAYCLMGLFGVSMPTNYGEGKKAFIRLQYDIMQHDPDMSLFAFGYRVHQHHGLAFHPKEEVNNNWKYLLADSPSELDYGFLYIPDSRTKQQYPPPNDSTLPDPFGADVELPRATVTSYGIELRLPICEADEITIAVTLCKSSGRHFGLFLTRDLQGKDPKRPRYFTGCIYSEPYLKCSTRYAARMVDLGDDLYNMSFNGKPVKASWRTIYVVPTASDSRSENSTTPALAINCDRASYFRVPRWLTAQFIALQFTVLQFRHTRHLQVILFLRDCRDGKARIFLSLGSCTKHRGPDPRTPPFLWAKVDIFSSHVDMDTFPHDCSEDHINSKSWETRSKDFGDADRKVRLSLSPSMPAANSLFVIHLELFGHLFERLLQEAGGSSLFPSLVILERETPRPPPNDPIASMLSHTPSQIEPPSSSFSDIRSSRVHQPASPHRHDSDPRAQASLQESQGGRSEPEQVRGSQRQKEMLLVPSLQPPRTSSHLWPGAPEGRLGTNEGRLADWLGLGLTSKIRIPGLNQYRGRRLEE